jgi:hypothetical protein
MKSGFSQFFLQPTVPGWSDFQLPTSNFRSQSSSGSQTAPTHNKIDFLQDIGADRIENTATNISSIVACGRCLAMAVALLLAYMAVAYKWLFLLASQILL